MHRGLFALIALSTLCLLGGCGSSSGTGTSSGGTTSTSVQQPTTKATSTTGAKTAPATGTPGLKVNTKPKYGKPPSSAPVLSGTVQVAYRNIAINPDTVRVKVGSTIRWTNYDPVEHNVTSEGGPSRFASRQFGEGQSFQITASRAGVIHYLCTIHPASMNGTIEVVK